MKILHEKLMIFILLITSNYIQSMANDSHLPNTIKKKGILKIKDPISFDLTVKKKGKDKVVKFLHQRILFPNVVFEGEETNPQTWQTDEERSQALSDIQLFNEGEVRYTQDEIDENEESFDKRMTNQRSINREMLQNIQGFQYKKKTLNNPVHNYHEVAEFCGVVACTVIVAAYVFYNWPKK